MISVNHVELPIENPERFIEAGALTELVAKTIPDEAEVSELDKDLGAGRGQPLSPVDEELQISVRVTQEPECAGVGQIIHIGHDIYMRGM